MGVDRAEARTSSEQLKNRKDEQSYGSRSERHGFNGPVYRISHWCCGFGMERIRMSISRTQ